MEPSANRQSPRRITDLVTAKAAGADVRLVISFEILPADFHHRANPFKAYIFLAKYTGTIDGKPFAFRKCYARGCPNNLCTHVSQAVSIANRYLQRDYHALKSAGINTDEALFSLNDMIVKFEAIDKKGPDELSIPELNNLARAGKVVTVDIELELIPAVEHFADMENAQTFLGAKFTAKAPKATYCCHRCFACFATDGEDEEKQTAILVANARLELVYNEFNDSGITHQPRYFN
jgi:hypothetical protein